MVPVHQESHDQNLALQYSGKSPLSERYIFSERPFQA